MIKVVSSLLFMVLLMGCDPSVTNGQASVVGCSSTVAHISVLDGMMIRMCGCQEANNTQFRTNQSMTCTVTAGTVVYFDFVGITVTHQVNVVSLEATPIVAPNNRQPTQSYPIKMNSVGTYNFYDIFFPTLGGSIVVQ